jgi:glutaredoxin
MRKNVIISTILLVLFLGFIFFNFWEYNKKVNAELNEETNGAILFYGINCPACEVLDQLMESQGINENSYEHKEVYYNQKNSKELIAKAGECGLNTSSISIPFLWVDGLCYVGVEPIINYFEQQAYD